MLLGSVTNEFKSIVSLYSSSGTVGLKFENAWVHIGASFTPLISIFIKDELHGFIAPESSHTVKITEWFPTSACVGVKLISPVVRFILKSGELSKNVNISPISLSFASTS